MYIKQGNCNDKLSCNVLESLCEIVLYRPKDISCKAQSVDKVPSKKFSCKTMLSYRTTRNQKRWKGGEESCQSQRRWVCLDKKRRIKRNRAPRVCEQKRANHESHRWLRNASVFLPATGKKTYSNIFSPRKLANTIDIFDLKPIIPGLIVKVKFYALPDFFYSNHFKIQYSIDK